MHVLMRQVGLGACEVFGSLVNLGGAYDRLSGELRRVLVAVVSRGTELVAVLVTREELVIGIVDICHNINY